MTHTDHQGQMLNTVAAPWWSVHSHSGSAVQLTNRHQVQGPRLPSAAAVARASPASMAVLLSGGGRRHRGTGMSGSSHLLLHTLLHPSGDVRLPVLAPQPGLWGLGRNHSLTSPKGSWIIGGCRPGRGTTLVHESLHWASSSNMLGNLELFQKLHSLQESWGLLWVTLDSR
uniref:Uncharacterized protein n=1 Tax=Myotis myotis TaxID=51298 RepID=A0A7J7Z563_MYOMY|nr:hypothetical protein mMyoMyo1_010637 [Myotis myotis]